MPWHCLRVNVWISVFGLLSVFGQGESSELGEQLGIWKNCPDLSYETVVFLVAAVWETGLYSAAQFVTQLFFWILKNCVILKNVALWETGLSKLRNLTNRLYDKLGCVGLLQYGTLGHFKVVANYNSVVFCFFFALMTREKLVLWLTPFYLNGPAFHQNILSGLLLVLWNLRNSFPSKLYKMF